ncbi:hypothetical protein [Pontibacter sp. SGAir0037]|uniref:Uncharacterized protein n=1 Tax=Pontibacter actiniarum TaxID=323450 RepID=A0A1X9YYN4_9BACT|nr:hypothetical protein [Pontibacter sp. SGAir0037]ARS37989.1 hypothetical protein CA264_20775 [Pontibacter actiniarum]QCR25319.1 hypothetical protein C1N53_22650 [Pontibacter sp. SGAir0037]
MLFIAFVSVFVAGCDANNKNSTAAGDRFIDSVAHSKVDSVAQSSEPTEGAEGGMSMIHQGMDLMRSGKEMVDKGYSDQDKPTVERGMRMIDQGMEMTNLGKGMMEKDKGAMADQNMSDDMDMMDTGMDMMNMGKNMADSSMNAKGMDMDMMDKDMHKGMDMMDRGMDMMDKVADKMKNNQMNKSKAPMPKDAPMEDGDM